MAWAPKYADLNELKVFAEIQIGTVEGDVQLNLALESASRAVDQACNRQFGIVATSTQAREYTPVYDRRRTRWIVETDDFPSTSALTITVDNDDDMDFADVTISSTAVRKWPFNAADVGRPHTAIIVNSGSTGVPVAGEGTVRVKAKWGWASVPDTVKEATLIQAARFYKRRHAPFGVAGSPEIGSELRLLNKVDPDVDLMLTPYKRMWGAV